MNSYPTTTTGEPAHKSYRSDWSLGGLVVSLSLVVALFAMLVAPLLVAATVAGAVSARLYARYSTTRSTPANPAQPTRQA